LVSSHNLRTIPLRENFISFCVHIDPENLDEIPLRKLATMATTDPTLTDPLYLLRRSLASNQLPIPTTSDDPDKATDDLSAATHLYFTHPSPQSLPLTTPTRFISADTPVDLRSIFLAFQKKDVPIPEYIASAQQLNEALEKADAGTKVLNLKFVERLDLITWLEGASEESEYIKPLEGADKGNVVAEPLQAAVPTAPTGVVSAAAPSARVTKLIDPRLQEIYNGERRMGDRNSILRGIKPTVRMHPNLSLSIFSQT
jgi:parafibromin